jgi:LPXTG-motif cell wall-anchored protein
MTVHVSGRRRVAVGLAAVAAGATALVGAFPGTAGAATATSAGGGSDLPFEHPCPEDGWYFHWGPTNQETVPGEHHQDDPAIDEPSSDEDFSVTISNIRVEDGKKTFDFETSVPVRHVFAMGYPNTDHTGNSYDYEPPVTEGTAQVNDDTYIKHVVFCPAPPPPSTTSSSTTSTSTTSTSTTTSTVPPSSETTVTTPPTSVEDTTPSTEAPTTAPPTTQPVGEQLPRTGNNTMPLVAGAGALIALGAAAVLGRRYLQNRA